MAYINESEQDAPHFGENMDYDFHRLLNEYQATVTPKSDEVWPVGAQLKNPVTVEKMPSWARSGDVIVRRDKKYFVVSLHDSETRWQRLLRWARRWIETH